jgi:uncharacterized protein (DUF1015 family)
MSLVRPVDGWLVDGPWAARVVSPLHDVLTDDERRAILAGNPDSYLHVTSTPEDLPGPQDASAGPVQARALQRLLDLGAYRRLPEPRVYVYEMRDQGCRHTGVIANIGVAGFGDGRVLGHERVQAERVDGLVRHYDEVGVRSELVALFHEADPVVKELTARVCDSAPLLEFTDAGGIDQSVWEAGAEESAELARQLDLHQHYIADGHHRVAAASRRWERDGRPDDSSVLCAIYPQDQLFLHAFHRRVAGPVDEQALLRGLETRFDVRRGAGPEVVPGSIGMYAAGTWHRLTPHERQEAPGVAGLDVTMLNQQVLGPLLGIEEGDPRLQFLPELRDLGPTLAACDADRGVLFTLHAPRIDQLIAVADRGEVMSAKTTYVRPKPRTGIFLQ